MLKTTNLNLKINFKQTTTILLIFATLLIVGAICLLLLWNIEKSIGVILQNDGDSQTKLLLSPSSTEQLSIGQKITLNYNAKNYESYISGISYAAEQKAIVIQIKNLDINFLPGAQFSARIITSTTPLFNAIFR